MSFFTPVHCRTYTLLQTRQDDSDSDDSEGHKDMDNIPGDYPTADDLDVILSSKMWTKVGGGSLAETGESMR